jgi:hypothetical protein
MYASITVNMVAAVASAALVAGLAVFGTSIVSRADGGSRVAGAVHEPHAKTDRLPIHVSGTACSARSWPRYEQECQFDLRRPASESRVVRVIALR